jgi:predicted ATPase
VWRSITLRNFKLFDEQGVAVDLRPVTVLIGANGAGKSSVLQALALLKQSKASQTLILQGPHLNLGSYRDVAHNQNEDLRMGIEVSADYAPADSDIAEIHPMFDAGSFDYKAEFVRGGALQTHSGTLNGERDIVLQGEWDARVASPTFPLPMREGIGYQLAPIQQISIPFQINSVSVPPDDYLWTRVTEQLISRLHTVFSLLEKTYLVPPIRGLDRPSYGVLPGIPELDYPAGWGPESQATYVVNAFAYQPELSAHVARYLQEVLGPDALQIRPRLAPNQQVSAETFVEGININLVNEAFGLNQLLLPLIGFARAGEGSVITIEEPEIHLHPKAQVALCGLFVELVKARRGQLILTTHSEHIIIGLLNAVTARRLPSTEISIYEFSRVNQTTRARRLEVNEFGQISGGLKGFMDVDIESLNDYLNSRFGQRE